MNFSNLTSCLTGEFTNSQIRSLIGGLAKTFEENGIPTANIDSYKRIKVKKISYDFNGLLIDDKLYRIPINGAGVNFLNNNEFEVDVIAEDQNGNVLIKDNCMVIQRLRCELDK